MNDESQTPGAGPEGTGQESSTGGASEWSTVPSPQPPQPPAEPPSPPAQSLEPLPTPPPAAPPPAAAGYQPVYGSQPQTPPPPQGPPPGYGGGPTPQYPPPPPPPAAGQGLSSNAAAAISYITFIPAVIFLVVEPYNRDRFVRFHAWQCIALTIVAVGIGILFAVLNVIGFHILWWMFMLIRLAIRLILFVFWLIALIKASQGQWYKIPIVGDLAVSLAGGQK
ncbi:MAG TPA: DUF4870 domain-containing protein [Acidobacteriaceae bacterium]|nr:DUF4870 domain-containing protein [Acidobacteriaceae bacterium]